METKNDFTRILSAVEKAIHGDGHATFFAGHGAVYAAQKGGLISSRVGSIGHAGVTAANALYFLRQVYLHLREE